MEALVIVDAQHKNQYYSRSRSQGGLARFNSTPSKTFREINCRTFHATKGILPSPIRSSSVPSIKQHPSLKSPSYSPKATGASRPKSTLKTTSIPIKTKPLEPSGNGFFNLSFSERWAGPTYSTSPPPSSLPIPKFLQLPKRTLSLELPTTVSDDDTATLHLIAKSAPTSPTRDFSPHTISTKDLFRSADLATQTLRRILNLDLDDE